MPTRVHSSGSLLLRHCRLIRLYTSLSDVFERRLHGDKRNHPRDASKGSRPSQQTRQRTVLVLPLDPAPSTRKVSDGVTCPFPSGTWKLEGLVVARPLRPRADALILLPTSRYPSLCDLCLTLLPHLRGTSSSPSQLHAIQQQSFISPTALRTPSKSSCSTPLLGRPSFHPSTRITTPLFIPAGSH